MSLIIAIDGPSGSGKGELAQALAKKYNLLNIDSGAAYRMVTLAILEENIKLDEKEKIHDLLERIKLELKQENGINQFYLNGKNVSEEIRSKEVTKYVSQVSSIPEIREKMVELFRKIANDSDSVLDGRDIGTVVFPNADVKIYLDADFEERVKRRYKQNKAKKIDMSIEEIRQNMLFRDKNDKEKEIGALKQAEDSIYLDDTKLNKKQTLKQASKIIDEKIKKQAEEKMIYTPRPDNKRKEIVRKRTNIVLTAFLKTRYKIEEINKDKIPETGAYILCANHINALDAFPIVVLNKRKIYCLSKYEIFKSRPLRWLAKLYDGIPVRRGNIDLEAMKRCINVLKNGELLAIFPEGTRNGLAKKEKVKSGAVYMAYKFGVPIIPIGIKGSFKPFTKVTYHYGDPIYLGKDRNPSKEVLEKDTEKLMNIILELTK